jgi:hypothetical protein
MNNGAADANQAYGALNESLHLARFSLERAFHTHLEPLISGDAWRECGAGFDDINAFMDSLRLDKFKVIAAERKPIVNRIKELQPDVSNRQIARTLGVDEGTVRNDAAENSAAPGKPPMKSTARKMALRNFPQPSLISSAATSLARSNGTRQSNILSGRVASLATSTSTRPPAPRRSATSPPRGSRHDLSEKQKIARWLRKFGRFERNFPLSLEEVAACISRDTKWLDAHPIRRGRKRRVERDRPA